MSEIFTLYETADLILWLVMPPRVICDFSWSTDKTSGDLKCWWVNASSTFKHVDNV